MQFIVAEFLLIGFVCGLNYTGESDVDTKFFKIFNASGFDIPFNKVVEQRLFIDSQILKLANQYEIEISEDVFKVKLLIQQIPDSDLFGAGLSALIKHIEKIRHSLAKKASDDELVFLDEEIFFLHSLEKSHENTVLDRNMAAINKEGFIGLNSYLIRAAIVTAFEAGDVQHFNPRTEVAYFLDALFKVDPLHPLSHTLQFLIDATENLRKALRAHKVPNETIGKINHLLGLLVQAKSLQDDTILDGLKGRQLQLYEQIVESLKELKTLLIKDAEKR
ncbi:unnamed protein product [Bursaphelenchus xylophilus]|uniref:(pine wood nematode) hypothetical protein n=1 Tax=Bursaphelenchus xylophilus TaxID=6326 RepID=A0A1I7RYI2_BURXY|nr:unnamed protein product [Bursaphelenchus xylophilus]CAG9092656.1 unnamed protein product [Bursaphelenchus xylophilus]